MRMNRIITCIALLFSAMIGMAQAGNGKLQIHHIDMGQGDAAVLISPSGKVVIFDAGRDMSSKKDCAVQTDYLEQLGVRQIDYIFVSHLHTDHIGCIPAVLEKFPLVTAAYDRGGQYASGYYTRYAASVGTKRKTAQLGQMVELEANAKKVTLKVVSLNGTYNGGQVSTENENDLSVAVLVSFGAFREEIGGDLSGEHTSTYEDIESGVAPSVGSLDVYKVHHHCSSHSSNGLWLKTTAPTVAIISTGDGNSYRHPTEDCLSRLHEAEISKVYWTERGAGAEPKVNDVIAGDVSIEVEPNAQRYLVTYGSGTGTVDTYKIKAAGDITNTDARATTSRYAWSERSQFYHYSDCAAVKRISPGNLRSGNDPPPGKRPSTCITQAAP